MPSISEGFVVYNTGLHIFYTGNVLACKQAPGEQYKSRKRHYVEEFF